jgi:aminoglycoside 6-adenylyltransferase
MRSEEEMIELIVNTACNDDRIRAVVMNGSRVNPGAPSDRFQDFDIAYFVTDVATFKHNFEWIKRFGDLMIMQMPEDMQDPSPTGNGSFVYLMQFMDGNRIDLSIYPLSLIDEIVKDSLSVVLVDKDGCIETLPPASDRDYLPKSPTLKAFSDCCNEFWWVCPYVAKGLWRQEIIYAKTMLDLHVREELNRMLRWYIGIKTDFSCNPGKLGKYFQRHLEPELWELLLKTYADADYDHTWASLLTMCHLFRDVALQTANHFGFDYPYRDAERVTAHLKHVRLLHKDAKEIYNPLP